MQKVKLTVAGRVQGVGFRLFAHHKASEIGAIYGRVWNNEDGTVTILAQSDQASKLSQFIQSIREGNFLAKVTYVDVVPTHFPDYHDFKREKPEN